MEGVRDFEEPLPFRGLAAPGADFHGGSATLSADYLQGAYGLAADTPQWGRSSMLTDGARESHFEFPHLGAAAAASAAATGGFSRSGVGAGARGFEFDLSPGDSPANDAASAQAALEREVESYLAKEAEKAAGGSGGRGAPRAPPAWVSSSSSPAGGRELRQSADPLEGLLPVSEGTGSDVGARLTSATRSGHASE